MKISSGKVIRPQKVVIYGSEGIGKSTLAAQFPNPLFIDTEGGTAQLDVRRIEKPQSFEELISIVNEVAADPTLCKTLILDTADWAEQLCITGICNKYKKPGIEDFGYGKGYTYLAEEYSRLLGAFDAVISAGMHVVITAHAKMRKFEQPDEMGAYDRWEMKLSKQVAPLLKEWCDLLLFCNYRTFVVTTQNDTKKAQGGKGTNKNNDKDKNNAKTTTRGGVNHDLNLRLDISLRKQAAITRDIATVTSSASSGNSAFKLSFMADYTVSRLLTLSAYYDRQTNTPLLSSSSYPTTTQDFGLSVKFSLTR